MGLSSARVNGVRHVVNATAPNPEAESQGIRSDWAAELYGTVATLAGLPSSGNWVGRQRWVTSERNFYVWMGSSWVPVGGATSATRIWAGTVSLTDSFQDFTFPPGVFTDAPQITFATFSSSAGSIGATVMVASRDKDKFRARKAGGTNSTIAHMYIAVQTP